MKYAENTEIFVLFLVWINLDTQILRLARILNALSSDGAEMCRNSARQYFSVWDFE